VDKRIGASDMIGDGIPVLMGKLSEVVRRFDFRCKRCPLSTSGN
jgi:hypothetical protein